MEVAELKGISERRAFPASSKLTMVSSTELEDDFSAMGVSSIEAFENGCFLDGHHAIYAWTLNHHAVFAWTLKKTIISLICAYL